MAIEKSKLDEKEMEKLVLDLHKKGLTSEKIGLQISKDHKIRPKKIAKVSTILRKHNIYVSADLQNVKNRLETLKKHIARNKQDKSAMRALITEESRLRKLNTVY